LVRSLNKLPDALARSSLSEGRYSDGGGLYLNVKATGTKSWIFMYVRDGRRQALGLGGYPALRLPAAREKAGELRTALATGADPKLTRAPKKEPTFAECTTDFLDSMESQWRNEKHRAQWRSTLGEAYCSSLLKMRVADITTDHVLKVLTPVWTAKPETASRIRGRIERVLDFAKVRGWRSGENPALWRGHLKNILPARQKLTRGHHAAMAYSDVPAFVQRLKQSEGMASRALEFLILCAARSGEALGAKWSELDLAKGIWQIPAGRMKAGRPHRVPLSTQALELLTTMNGLRTSEYVFPGQKEAKPLSSMSMEMQLRRMKLDVTVHGFRSSFRDWAGEETGHAREVAEAALAHVVGDATERAYRRSDALEKRRALMQEWACYLSEASND
jgi:integrase